MGNRIKAWNILSRVVFILVFLASIGVFWLTRTGEGFTDFIINLVFAFLAALFLIIYFVGCARPLTKVASALSRVTDNIRRSDEDAKSLWGRYGQNGELFANKRVDERYGAYLREVHRLQKQNSLTATCRIEDYIDEELIYSAVNKSFCDQLGGIMSGLGILFTFIGLVYGLRNFDASSVDVMQTSTQALMAGIKIAFLTSIFGLIYSLLFGLFYKKLLHDSMEALYDFQDAYSECVRPVNEHAAENAMIRLQMEQNAALQNFGTNIGDQVSEAIIKLMQPSVDTLQQTISQYVTVAIEDQRAGMEKVVRYFLDSMNTSLGGIFVQLKTRTEELARWEKTMIDAISDMTDNIGRTTAGLADAQVESRKIADTMSQYTDAIQSLTAEQQGVIENMRVLMDDYHELHKQEADYIRALAASAQAAADNVADSHRVAESVAAIAESIQTANADSARQIITAGQLASQSAEAIRALSESVASDMTAASQRLEHSVAALDGSLTRTMSDSLAVMDDSISRLTSCLTGVNTAAGNVANAMKGLPRTVAAMDGDIKATAKVIDTELKLLLKAVSDTEKSLTRFSDELDRRTDL